MILSYRNKSTALVAQGKVPKGFPANLLASSLRKLNILNAAEVLEDLRSPPGNHLEALKGGRKGQYSIRINQQYRICFIWTYAGPQNVEIVDYH